MYESCKLYVNNMVRRTYGTQELADEYAQAVGLKARDALRVMLLMEETIGMVSDIAGPFEAEIWLQGNRDACEICLEARVGDGRPVPEVPHGLMARIGEILRCGYLFDHWEEVPEAFREALPSFVRRGLTHTPMMVGRWSLSTLRKELGKLSLDDPDVQRELGELEMSIVAHIADDVTVGIHQDKLKLVITRSFGA